MAGRRRNPVNVDVKPGETVQVAVGGTGRPVVGRLVAAGGIALADFVLDHGGKLSTAATDAADSGRLPRLHRRAAVGLVGRLPQDARGARLLRNGERQYAVVLHPDGTFRIEDVPAGRYVLTLPFDGRTQGDRSSRLAFARAEVVVPEIRAVGATSRSTSARSRWTVFPFRELNVGDPAPAVTPKAADGRPLDLAALRGKFVLLSFWATIREIWATSLHLKATYDAFGRDPRFVMIGLSQDIAPDVARRYAARHGLAWEQRYLGSSDDPNPIAAAFGVRYPPQVILIGPDGRLIAKDLQGERIKRGSRHGPRTEGLNG